VLRRALPAVSVGAAACAALGLAPGVGHAAPAPVDPREAAEQHISALYQQAEAATQEYDADQERIARLQAAIDAAGGQIAAQRQTLASLLGGLGRLAAQQYRDPAYASTLQLLFATHPDDYLERAGLGDRVAALDAQHIRTVEQLQRQLDVLTALGAQEMQQLQAARTRSDAERGAIESELAQARAELASLGAAARRAVGYELLHGGLGEGFGAGLPTQAPPLRVLISAAMSSALGAGHDSARARTAIAAAYSELGKPYEWGAVGPGEFDCSGLMQHAWGEAGVSLPRTSQEQADAGPGVPLSRIRPGDLVIYFPGRTHVGMYVGDGLVIHAPHPGSEVQFAPVTAMPINKIVRPDAS
jgi:cell wall-associated NlpC family hydrolase